MSGKRKISIQERRHQDYLRLRGTQVAAVYQRRLMKDRRAELRRVLDLCRDAGDVDAVASILEGNLTETGYLGSWWEGLWIDTGLPMAKSTARDLRVAKAAGEGAEDFWLASLKTYARQRAGNTIVIVTGTWKDTLLKLLRQIMIEEVTISEEKLTDRLYRDYLASLEKWQCRRIAQTEALIGMADAAAVAANTLDVGFTKQWCISGLGNTRASHELEDGVEVDQNEPFSLPGGFLMYPHDVSLGANADEIINCACACIRRPK